MAMTRDGDEDGDREVATGDGHDVVAEPAVLGAADEGDEDDPEQRDRDEELPPEAHELVVPRRGAASRGATRRRT